ncbi:MAG: DUF2207 domain-containing protein [Burkholderiaceae bacterium]|nr:DUF2207 domain-containing protein [Burkholderiaceae bacterium]MEB2350569.1 DUF2207 domain-containing protein [Burkholderiaceae bacterium]
MAARLALAARVAVLALAGLAASAPGPARASEAIEHFDSAVEVRADGDLAVTETIVVRAEGAQIRRGIYRDFPLRFRDAGGPNGPLREVGFELLEVTRDGRPEPHFTRRNERGVRIYAGDEDVLLQPGRYTYRLRYLTSRQLRHFADHVELYWNVTGNDWAFPIREATATIRLPGNAAPVRWTGYTGRFGERGQDFRAALQADGALGFATTRTLLAGEGLTVVAELPAGVVAAPTQAQQWGYALLDHRRGLLAGLGLLGVLAFYVIAWRAVGRDPPKGTIIALFHPPEGISPALAAYIRNWGWKSSWREFTAAAVSLAVKGLLVFDDRGGTLTLRRADPGSDAQRGAVGTSAGAAAPLPAGERALLDWVNERGGSARVERASGESLVAALGRFKTAIEKDNRNRFFRRNLGWFAAGIALTALAVAATFKFGYVDDDEIGLMIGAVVVGVFVGGFVVGTTRRLLAARSLRTIIPAAIHAAVLLFAVSVISTMISGFGISTAGFRRTALDALAEHGFPLALVGGFALLNGLFFYLLRAPTAAGRPVMDRIEGLELYLRTAESARMNLAGAPELTSTHFERLLPYAIALEAEEPWSGAFEAAFARAHPGEDLNASYRPAWHTGSRWSGDNLGSAVSGAVAAAEASFASAAPPPSSSSSGFGGGGSSGGGGGGGGGGGW